MSLVGTLSLVGTQGSRETQESRGIQESRGRGTQELVVEILVIRAEVRWHSQVTV